MSASLPDSWDPTIFEGIYYYDVIVEIPDTFTFALIANDLTWDNWYDAAIDDTIYSMTTAEAAAATKFSSFIISHQIFARRFGDGVCMIDSKNGLGAVCLMVTSESDATTFRPK